jgi:hypothetical protein
MTDLFSTGPFNRVFFVYDRDGLHTYRYRLFNTEPARTLVNTLMGMYTGIAFHDIYERTST